MSPRGPSGMVAAVHHFSERALFYQYQGLISDVRIIRHASHAVGDPHLVKTFPNEGQPSARDQLRQISWRIALTCTRASGIKPCSPKAKDARFESCRARLFARARCGSRDGPFLRCRCTIGSIHGRNADPHASLDGRIVSDACWFPVVGTNSQDGRRLQLYH
jgi:hypothetical protein